VDQLWIAEATIREMEGIEERGYQSEPADGSGEVSRPAALFRESLLSFQMHHSDRVEQFLSSVDFGQDFEVQQHRRTFH
jgi:hypothetical protein